MTAVLERIRSAGFPVTEVLGAGMEGTVAALDEERVVKLWDRRDRTQVERLRIFYDAVEASGFALAVPRILQVAEVAGSVLTVQVRLTGKPIARAEAVVEVLAALAEVPVHPDLAVLPVPDGEPPFDPVVPFALTLADLVERRAGLLEGRIDAGTVAALADDLRRLEPAEPRLVHGDLGPTNVLAVDGRPAALLDFGYLSTVGDPAFDAAVAAALSDMFGPGAAAATARMDRLTTARFGYGEERLALYRAAYGLITASCLTASVESRHFCWCLAWLRPGHGPSGTPRS